MGRIEVVCYETTFSHLEVTDRSSSKFPKFSQANKKDVLDITKKEYTMSTTRAGKLLKDSKPYDRPEDKKSKPKQRAMWNIGDEVKKIHVEYHMTQTLYDWGIEPVRPMWPEQDKGPCVVKESSTLKEET